jgi:hypothetical protein
MEKLKQFFLLLFLLAIISPFECCVYIPTHDDKVLSGRQIKKDQLQFVELSVTSKSEVIERFGPPEIFWEDEHIMAYCWEMRKAMVPWMIPGGVTVVGGVIELGKKYDLFIQLDECDRVKRFEWKAKKGHKNILNRMQDWLQEVKESKNKNNEKRSDSDVY